MKKTLAAIAILGAFAGSAMADVTVYGRINTGFAFNDTTVDYDGVTKVIDEQDFAMNSGDFTGSRIGFKGSEQISEGLKASFVLEGGFNGDTGSATLFQREATVSVTGAYGTVGFGRMGTLQSDAGTYGTFASIASVMGTGVLGAEGIGLFANAGSRISNAVVYQSPVMAGFQVAAQYGTVADTSYNDEEGDRYAAVAATYKVAGLKVAAIAEEFDKGNGEEQQMFGLGGTYDFGVAKVSLAGQYFKGAEDIAGQVALANEADRVLFPEDEDTAVNNAEGYGLTFGVAAPVCGGNLAASVTYVDGDTDLVDEDWTVDVKAWNVGVNYDYNLSKQLKVYVGAGYTKSEIKDVEETILESDTYSAYTGMVYYF